MKIKLNNNKILKNDVKNNELIDIDEIVLESCRSKLGKETSIYKNIRDEMSQDMSLKIKYKIPVIMNSQGYATLLINPNYLISDFINSKTKYSDYCYISNVQLANHENGSCNKWKKLKNMITMASIPYKFESYKFESGFININENLEDLCINLENSNEPIQNNQLAISTINGKAIVYYFDTYAIFTNKFNLNLINCNVNDRVILELDSRIHYKMMPLTSTNSKYNRNGFNIVDEPPMILRKYDSLKELINLNLKKFSEDVLDNNENELLDYNDNIKSIDFIKKVETYTNSQIQIYNNTDEKNENVFRLDFKMEKFSSVVVDIELRYSIKENIDNVINNNLYTISGEDVVIRTAFSNKEKAISLIATQLAKIAKTIDYDTLVSIFNTNKKDKNYNKINNIIEWIINKIDQNVGPVIKTIKEVTESIEDVIKKIVS